MYLRIYMYTHKNKFVTTIDNKWGQEIEREQEGYRKALEGENGNRKWCNYVIISRNNLKSITSQKNFFMHSKNTVYTYSSILCALAMARPYNTFNVNQNIKKFMNQNFLKMKYMFIYMFSFKPENHL